MRLPPTLWDLPDPRRGAPGEDLLAVGADLETGTVLNAYARGLFPMNIERDGPLGWWSPDPRGILPLDALRVTRSLRRSCARYSITVNRSFDDVMSACGDASRADGWITDEFRAAYGRLHREGWAHSVEVRDERRLVGGLYGVQIGGLFAGESMFHRERDASKVALVALVERLADVPGRLLDVQWATDHLRSLGAIAVPRADYLELLPPALLVPPAFT